MSRSEAVARWAEPTDEDDDFWREDAPLDAALEGISPSDAVALIHETVERHGVFAGHELSDRIVMAVLRTLGANEVADAWLSHEPKWYYS